MVFSAAKKAYASLSSGAKSAIDKWEAANWTGGDLEQHVKAQDDTAQEIEAAFAPVRALLPNKVGLYRGIIKQDQFTTWQHGILESWTTDRRVADHFAGLRNSDKKWTSFELHVRSAEEIDKLVAKYEATGFVKIDGRYYIRNKDHPQYYNIYNANKSFITDGDDLRRDLESDAADRQEINTNRQSKAHVFEEEISRDRIVWITNSANCKEFIVRK